MLRIVPFRLAAPRRTFVLPGFVAAIAVPPLGCGADESQPRVEAASRDHATAGEATVSGVPSPAQLLAWLHQGHRIARERLGPHQLSYQARFSVSGGSNPPATVVDDLSLTWASPAGDPPRFRLEQHNDHGRGRELVVAKDSSHVRILPRPWVQRPLETELYEVWLDDAQRSVHDVVALAVDSMQITPLSEVETHAGRSVATYELALGAPSPEPTAKSDEHPAWRQTLKVDSLEGRLVVDVQTGLWLEADVRVEYTSSDEDTSVQGKVAVRATVTPGPTPAIEPPADVQPLSALPRYEHEQRQLLEGIAAI